MSHAEKLSSESEITLEETGVAPGYEPDGSKAFEERQQQREAQREQEILAELERSLRTPSPADQPMGFVMDPPKDAFAATPTKGAVAATPPKVERPTIKLGGNDTSKEGSWIYPPTPTRDFVKLANFWATVKLDDAAINNIERADRLGRDLEKWRTKTLNEMYDEKWPRKRRKADPEGWDAWVRKNTLVSERGDRVANGWGLIPRADLRDIVRVGAFWRQIRDMPEDVQSAAYNLEFEMTRGEKITALDAVNRYELIEIMFAWFGEQIY